jgi:hypothetical protein
MSNGHQAADEAPPVGRAPTREGLFYVEWGAETLKRNLTLANEVLRSLLTLSATMLGGSIAFLDKVATRPFPGIAAVLFLLALIASLLGVLPYEGEVDLRIPKQIEQHKRAAFEKKVLLLKTAGGLLALGFIAALVGMAVHP